MADMSTTSTTSIPRRRYTARETQFCTCRILANSHRTVEMPWRDPPEVDFDKSEEYRWPFWNVDLEEEDLFGILHKRFNTTQMFVQDPKAFHKDVCEMAYLASDQADFYDRLKERSDKRLEELKSALKVLDLLDSGGFYNLDDKQNFAFFRTRRFASLDCLILFFASFLGPNHRGQLPSECRHYLMDTSTSYGQVSGDADLQDATAVTPMRTERAWPQEQQESEQGSRAKKRKRSQSATDGDSAGRDSNSQINRKATKMNVSNANERSGVEKSEKPSHAYLNSKNCRRQVTVDIKPSSAEPRTRVSKLSGSSPILRRSQRIAAKSGCSKGPSGKKPPSSSLPTDHARNYDEVARADILYLGLEGNHTTAIAQIC